MSGPKGGNSGHDWNYEEVGKIVESMQGMLYGNAHFLGSLPDNLEMLDTMNDAANTMTQGLKQTVLQMIPPILHHLDANRKKILNEAWQQVAQLYQARYHLPYDAHRDVLFRVGGKRRTTRKKRL